MPEKSSNSIFVQFWNDWEGVFGRVKKCDCFKTIVECLGSGVGEYGVKPSLAKAQAVVKWLVPASVKDIQSFWGLASFYRKFIRFLARLLPH